MTVFPVFPFSFPVCSQSWPNEILAFPVFRILSHAPYGLGALRNASYSTIRNTGNIRNTIQTTRVGPGSHLEQMWNTGNWDCLGHSVTAARQRINSTQTNGRPAVLKNLISLDRAL